MKSVTRWSDIVALNGWAALRSKPGWLVSALVAAYISADVISPRLEQEGQSVLMAAVLFFVLFVALIAVILIISLVLALVFASAQVVRKGTVGPRSFAITDQAFTEDDGYKTTSVAWGKIRTIDKTRRHIFVRISRWKYMLLSARDFQNEYQFAQYYADLVKAKHENT